MKYNYWLVSVLLIATLSTSCSSSVKPTDYINKNAPMTLTVATTHTETGLTTKDASTIQPTSDKYKHLINWLNNNNEGWTSTPASFIFNCSIEQNDFRLLYNSKSVIIGFKDKNGQPRQFIKTTKDNDLEFLMSDQQVPRD